MATVDRFFKEGQSAFYKPKKYGRFMHHACNPYTSTSFRGKEWQRGFNSAYFANLKKVKNYEFRRRGKKVYV